MFREARPSTSLVGHGATCVVPLGTGLVGPSSRLGQRFFFFVFSKQKSRQCRSVAVSLRASLREPPRRQGSHSQPSMPPRAKRKRASDSVSSADSPATSRQTRSSSGSSYAREEDEEQEPPILVPVATAGERLPTDFASQRRQGLLLDAELAVDGTRIKAHKCVLIAFSPFLKGLITSDLAEASSSGPVVIRGVDGAAVTACVDCMYSGSIALTGANVSAVIRAANMLCITRMEEAACAFFVGRLEPETALDALGFAEGMAAGGARGEELHSQVLTYVHEHFAECVATPAFVRLAPSSLGALIESDKLCVESEEVVLSALRRWYEHDEEGRTGALVELVPRVRFPLLPVEQRLRLGAEPLLLALGKLDIPKLAQLLVECVTEFTTSPAAAACPRLKRRLGNAQLFTFSYVDNTNAGQEGDMSGGMFDTAGVLYHIATEGGTSAWVNPHTAGRVVASLSSRGSYLSAAASFVQHGGVSTLWTQDKSNSWMAVDLGAERRLAVNHYALRHGGAGGNFVLRNWELQASQDGVEWTTLRRHDNDRTMEAKGYFVAQWAIEGLTTAYRHFRVHQHGRNWPGSEELLCNGIELYGALTAA
eukprot:COSAG01_NODE_485_length_16397_cov_48.193827_10_plen_594_part_00